MSQASQRPGLAASNQCVLFQCMKLLVEHSAGNSDTSKIISTSVPGLITSIVSLTTAPTPALLTCSLSLLSELMTRFPGSCCHSRVKIQELLTSLLGHRSVDQQLVGHCWTLLCQVGGGGREGVEHTTQYNNSLSSLVSTVHVGLNTVFSGVRELDQYQDIVNTAQPLNIFTENNNNLEKQTLKIQNVLTIIGEMLVRGFPQKRRVPVESVLSVGGRIMNIKLDTGVSTPRHQLLTCLHLTLSSSALTMTRALVTSLRDQLIPEAARVNSLIISGLTRGQDAGVRGEVYQLMSAWLDCAGLGSGVEFCSPQIVNFIVKDLVPPAKKMTLQTSVGGGKKNKKKKGGGNNQKVKTRGGEDTAEDINDEVSEAAVTALEKIISTVGGWLDKVTHTKITQVVLTRLLVLDSHHRLLPGLLSCLQSLVSSSSPTTMSPGQLALPIISKHLHSPQLSSTSRTILLAIMTQIQPSRPTLDIRDLKSYNSDVLTINPEVEEEEEELELISTASQTDPEDKTDKPQEEENVDNEELRGKCSKLEQKVSQLSSSEMALRAKISRYEKEIRQLKDKAEKRTSSNNANHQEDNLSPSKKLKTHEKPVTEELTVNEAEDKPGDGDDKDQLSVEEMMKDFHDQLVKNILPKHSQQDSDSD